MFPHYFGDVGATDAKISLNKALLAADTDIEATADV